MPIFRSQKESRRGLSLTYVWEEGEADETQQEPTLSGPQREGEREVEA